MTHLVATPREKETATNQPEGQRDERIHFGAETRTAVMIAQRELIRFTRARSRLISGLFQPVVFLFLLGYGLGPLVGDVGNVSFMQFMLPGIIAMSIVLTATFSTGLSIVWDREFGFLREMLVAPPSRAALIIGKIVGGALVATAQGTILLLLAPLVGIALTPLLLLSAIGVEALAAVALTALGVFIGSRMEKMQSFQVLMGLILMPMIYLSGATFPLRDLPAWLAILAHLNPLTYAVDPLRRIVLSTRDLEPTALDDFGAGLRILGHTPPIAVELLAVAGFALVFLTASIRAFSKPD